MTWNRIADGEASARAFEFEGRPVLVTENGYLGNSIGGTSHYALSLGHHNGAGVWYQGGPERWAALGVELAPWRPDGGEVVILPQRGIGPPGVAMPLSWSASAKQLTKGRVRQHPGTSKAGLSLEDDLRRASLAVTWGSGAAIKALVMGIPVFHGMPNWIGADAALPLSEFGKEPLRNEAARQGMFERLAWAQWSLNEFKTGEAFATLLG